LLLRVSPAFPPRSGAFFPCVEKVPLSFTRLMSLTLVPAARRVTFLFFSYPSPRIGNPPFADPLRMCENFLSSTSSLSASPTLSLFLLLSCCVSIIRVFSRWKLFFFGFSSPPAPTQHMQMFPENRIALSTPILFLPFFHHLSLSPLERVAPSHFFSSILHCCQRFRHCPLATKWALPLSYARSPLLSYPLLIFVLPLSSLIRTFVEARRLDVRGEKLFFSILRAMMCPFGGIPYSLSPSPPPWPPRSSSTTRLPIHLVQPRVPFPGNFSFTRPRGSPRIPP